MKRLTNITTRCLTIFTILLLATLTSCKKDIGTDTTPADGSSTGNPISFSTHDAFSKAVINSKTDLEQEGNSFKVFGWFEGTTPGHMFGEGGTPVTFKDEVWTYEPVRYWMNGTYDFAAVYPSTVNARYDVITSGQLPLLTVTDFDVTNQDDLLIAFKTSVDGSNGNANTAVELNFQHSLSNIQLHLTLDEKTFYEPIEGGKRQVGYAFVSLIGFNFISTSGSLSASINDPQNFKWSTQDLDNRLRINYTDKPIEITDDNTVNFLGENGVLVIPQSFRDEACKAELIMQVTIYPLGVTSEGIVKEFAVPLKSGVLDWMPNTKYIYEGVVKQELVIDFSVTTVNGWEKNTLGGFIVS